MWRALLLSAFFSNSLPAASDPNRLVVLSPALVEIIFALKEGHRIVGVTDFANYPLETSKITKVGDYSKPTIEKIVALKPDLVLVQDEGADEITENLTRSKLNWTLIHLRELEDYPRVIDQLDKILNPDRSPSLKTTDMLPATRLKYGYQQWLKSLQEIALSAHKPKSLLVQVDHDPIVLAGQNTFLSQALSKCKMMNLVDGEKGYFQPTLEKLLTLHPQVVVVTAHIKENLLREKISSYWSKRNVNYLFADPDTSNRLTPRFLTESLRLCRETFKQ